MTGCVPAGATRFIICSIMSVTAVCRSFERYNPGGISSANPSWTGFLQRMEFPCRPVPDCLQFSPSESVIFTVVEGPVLPRFSFHIYASSLRPHWVSADELPCFSRDVPSLPYGASCRWNRDLCPMVREGESLERYVRIVARCRRCVSRCK